MGESRGLGQLLLIRPLFISIALYLDFLIRWPLTIYMIDEASTYKP